MVLSLIVVVVQQSPLANNGDIKLYTWSGGDKFSCVMIAFWIKYVEIMFVDSLSDSTFACHFGFDYLHTKQGSAEKVHSGAM